MGSFILILFLILLTTPILVVLATFLAIIPFGLLGCFAHIWFLKKNKNEMKLYSTITVKMKDTEEFKDIKDLQRAA